MSNTLDKYSGASKEYQWQYDGYDGLRSYSYAASDSTWSYNTELDESNKNDKGAYLFSDSSTGQPFARRGNLYNWTAATLGSSLVFTPDDDVGEQAADSICPRGWQLPDVTIDDNESTSATKASDRTFPKLLRAYNVTDSITGSNRLAEWPLQYLPTGYYSDGYVNYRTTSGYWWTNTASSDSYSYNMASSNHYVYSQTDYTRGYGFALRCEAKFTPTYKIAGDHTIS